MRDVVSLSGGEPLEKTLWSSCPMIKQKSRDVRYAEVPGSIPGFPISKNRKRRERFTSDYAVTISSSVRQFSQQ
jgi:hypothetical protein